MLVADAPELQCRISYHIISELHRLIFSYIHAYRRTALRVYDMRYSDVEGVKQSGCCSASLLNFLPQVQSFCLKPNPEVTGFYSAKIVISAAAGAANASAPKTA
jgi:hypothetical protein